MRTVILVLRSARRTSIKVAAHASHATHGVGTRSSTGSGTTSQLAEDGHDLLLELLLLVLILLLLSSGMVVQPRVGGIEDLLDLLDVLSGNLVLELRLVEGVTDGEDVVLESVLGLNTGTVGLILSLELLSLLDHSLDLIGGESALIVLDGNLVLLTSTLLNSGDVQDTIGIDIEGDLNLRDTTGHGRNAVEVELAEKVVVLGHGTLTLVDLNEDTGLVILIGGEDLGLLGGNGGVTGDKRGHDTSSGLDTEGKRGDIEKKKLVELGASAAAGKNGGLDGGTVGDSLIGVDGLAELLAVEELLEHLLDLGNTGGTTDEDDLVDLGLGELGVTEDLLDGTHGLTEVVHVELLETGTSDLGVEVDTLEERIDLNVSLSGGGKGSLGTLAVGSQTTESTLGSGDILVVLSLELADEVLDESVIEIFTTEVSITGSGLDLEDTVLNGEEGDIEGTTTEIEDENVLLALLLVETVGNSGGGGLVDDTEDVEASDGSGILGSLSLRIVEVSGDGDDGVLDFLADVGLGDLLHLGEDHGGDFLSGEGLLLTLVGDLDGRLVVVAGVKLEGPVLHIALDGRIAELTTNQTLGVEDGVLGVHGDLVLGGVTNETLGICEGDVGGSSSLTLIVGDNLNTLILPNTNAGVGGTQIDTN